MKDTSRDMAWVLGSAAEVASCGGWTREDFVGVAGYVYGLEAQRRLRRSANYRFRRVASDAAIRAIAEQKRSRPRKSTTHL